MSGEPDCMIRAFSNVSLYADPPVAEPEGRARAIHGILRSLDSLNAQVFSLTEKIDALSATKSNQPNTKGKSK